MKVSLTPTAILVLWRMLNHPGSLSPDNPSSVKPYTAKTPEAGAQILSLQKWVAKDLVLVEPQPDNITKVEAPKPWSGDMHQADVAVLVDVCEHYKPQGLSLPNLSSYLELWNALQGKPFAVEELKVTPDSVKAP